MAITQEGRRCLNEPSEEGDNCHYHVSRGHGWWPVAAEVYKRYAARPKAEKTAGTRSKADPQGVKAEIVYAPALRRAAGRPDTRRSGVAGDLRTAIAVTPLDLRRVRVMKIDWHKAHSGQWQAWDGDQLVGEVVGYGHVVDAHLRGGPRYWVGFAGPERIGRYHTDDEAKAAVEAVLAM